VTRAAVGLGSNLGDRKPLLEGALERLAALGRVVARSSFYETAPVGGPRQGPYLNAVAILDTELGPQALLEGLLQIEAAMGRERRVRWGPRRIDLDLLLYGSEAIDQPGLSVPHPRLAERRFALDPLLEVWPDARLPDGRSVADLAAAVADQRVERITPPPTDDTFSPRHSWLVFLVVGLGAVVLWWLIDWVLGLLR
jgi:2-amino-4-hydroxy-6-hydroxymethyldihydropteridine diphosphokinase